MKRKDEVGKEKEERNAEEGSVFGNVIFC